MLKRSGARLRISSTVRIPAMPLPMTTRRCLAGRKTVMARNRRASSGFGRAALALVEEAQHLAAAMHVGLVLDKGEAVARPRQRNVENLADDRRRAVGHHHDAVGEQ